jgi:septal ring-binding cell division protein DamX
MQRHRVLRTGGILLACAVMVGGLPGCTPSSATTTTSSSLRDAVRHYDAQRYNLAYDDAVKAMRGDARSEAAYVAGLSACKLQKHAEAEQHLRTASRSSHRETAGKAKAQLGLLELKRGHASQAAVLLEDAATMLEGRDADQARRHAQQARAVVDGRGGALDVAPTGSFSLQVGAFREHDRAQKAADEARQLATRQGIEDVRIVRGTTPQSANLYLVQLGSFASRTEATRVRSALGRLDYIVTATNRHTRRY